MGWKHSSRLKDCLEFDDGMDVVFWYIRVGTVLSPTRKLVPRKLLPHKLGIDLDTYKFLLVEKYRPDLSPYFKKV